MVEQPESFSLTFLGPDGPYRLTFHPNRDEGEFHAEIGQYRLIWNVFVCERDGPGWRLAGLTRGSAPIWGDTFWFECMTADRPRIEYGDQGLVRTDYLAP